MTSVPVCVGPAVPHARRILRKRANTRAHASLMTQGVVARIHECSRADRLLNDSYAQHLVDSAHVEAEASAASYDAEIVVARTFDAAAMNAVQLRGVRQVVSLGHGGDTRGYRLEWPPGVRVFELAPFDAVAHAELAFSRAGIKPTKGTLLRRVAADVSGPAARGGGWADLLQQAGFFASQPSIWTLQGLNLLSTDALLALLLEVGDCAALQSELVGEIDVSLLQSQLRRVLADAGFHLEHSATLQEVSTQFSRTLSSDAQHRAVFSAVKTRVTGVQGDMLRAELDRAEYESGEAGFDDMP